MSSEEKGVYIDLLALSWIRNGMSSREARRVGAVDVVDRVLADKFYQADGLWFNLRIEEERSKQGRRTKGGKTRAKRAGRGADGKLLPANSPAEGPAKHPANSPAKHPAKGPGEDQQMGPAKNQVSDSVSESSKEDSLRAAPPMPADGQAASPKGRRDCRMSPEEAAREKRIRAAVANGMSKAEAVEHVDGAAPPQTDEELAI